MFTRGFTRLIPLNHKLSGLHNRMEVTELPTAVGLVCRSQPQVDALPHVAPAIAAYVGLLSADWTIERAAAERLPYLLDRLLAQEAPDLGHFFRSERFDNGVECAARDGSVEILNWWTTKYMPNQSLYASRIADAAAKNGHVNVLQWLRERDQFPSSGLQRICSDWPHVLYWLRDQGIGVFVNVCLDAAAKAGDLPFLLWMHEQPSDRYHVSCTKAALIFAIERGDLDMVQWLRANRPEFAGQFEELFSQHSPPVTQVDRANMPWPYTDHPASYFELPDPLEVTEGHLRIFRWLSIEYEWRNRSHRSQWVNKVALFAASCGNIEMAEVLSDRHPLHAQGAHRFVRPMRMAAFHGQLEMVKWLFSEGARCTTHAMDGAAMAGHLEIVQWLQEHGTYGPKHEAMDLAAWNNHMHVLRWLHEIRPTQCCSKRAMDAAAGRGHLEIVKWLHKNRREGCTKQAMNDAAANGHFHVVKWLHTNRKEGCTPQGIDRAAVNGHVEIVDFLRHNRLVACSAAAMSQVVANGHLDVVKWLQINLTEGWRPEVVDKAAVNGHLAIVEFFTVECGMSCTNFGMRRTYEANQFAVLEWLLVHNRLERTMLESFSQFNRIF